VHIYVIERHIQVAIMAHMSSTDMFKKQGGKIKCNIYRQTCLSGKVVKLSIYMSSIDIFKWHVVKLSATHMSSKHMFNWHGTYILSKDIFKWQYWQIKRI
jgi:hypothetical protein